MAYKIFQEFVGDCHKVQLVPRGEGDSHVCVRVLTEDDGHWSENMEFSSFWLGELIEQLRKAQRELFRSRRYKQDKADGKPCGWRGGGY